ncbi:CBL-interacting serine/threonine-protein kinase 4 [Acorus calamus]|uniref:non-specific serine/threonine protein kinase n=1 Tax=Acorus calamus TaxID=4465 RepID=A0AAV9EQZ8_ACOCL|nr:CBL-interacting serine/threonine-protein kinase 4 [Acorus calamus]
MYRKMRRREFGFPGWFPPQARRVVLRLLDPNLETRIGLDAVADLAWLKRRASDVRCGGVGLGEEKAMMAWYANAFDIIACSSGLDLSGLLFDGGRRRFAAVAACRAEVLVERVVEVGVRGGYVVERGSREGRGVGLGKGGMVVVEVGMVEFGEEKEPLLVEVVVGGDGGGGGKVEEVCWEELREGLKDIVFAWQNG